MDNGFTFFLILGHNSVDGIILGTPFAEKKKNSSSPSHLPQLGIGQSENNQWDVCGLQTLPSGYVKIAIENGHRNSGFSH